MSQTYVGKELGTEEKRKIFLSEQIFLRYRCGLQIRNKAMPKELTRHLLTLVIAIQI